ncbi:MAG: CHAT domain-containing protein [Planctomycetaceae bacterium]
MSHWQLTIQASQGRVETSLVCRDSRKTLGTFSDEAPRDRIAELTQEIHRTLAFQSQRDGTEYDVEDLQLAGERLGRLLVGETLLQRIKQQRPESLLIDTQCEVRGIPVEMLVIGDEFLGRITAVGRGHESRSEMVTPHSGRQVKPLIHATLLADATFELLYAQYEAGDIRWLWERRPDVLQLAKPSPLTPQTSFLTIDDALRTFAAADWLHVCGHATKSDDQAGVRGWLFRDGLLTSATLRDAGLRRVPRFVFANACGSAEQPSAPDAPLTVLEQLTQQGCEYFLGACVPIRDADSRSFVTAFYQAVLAGRSIGEAVRLGRLKLIEELQETNLLWASYVLHGDPRSVLVPDGEAQSRERENLSRDRDMFLSRDRQGAVVGPGHSPLPHGRGSENSQPLPGNCAQCGRPIFTAHGIGQRLQIDGQAQVHCRHCVRSSRHIPCAVSQGNADGTWNVPATQTQSTDPGEPEGVSPRPIARSQGLTPNGITLTAAEACRREEHFLGKWQHAVERLTEYRDSASGQTYSVTLAATPISLSGAAVGRQVDQDQTLPRLGSQKLTWQAPKRFLGRAALPAGLPQVSLHTLGRAACYRATGQDQGPLGVAEIQCVLRQLPSASATAPQVVCLASLTGWDQSAQDFVRGTSADAYFDANRSLVLLDLTDDSRYIRDNDLRVLSLETLFDFEDDHHKVARIVQHIESKLPLEMSLAASSLAQELSESERIIVLAMQQAAQRFELRMDNLTSFGWVLSQPAAK